MLFPLKRASAYPHQDAPLLAGVAYNPVTQMSEIGGVAFLDAGAAALAATAHTTTAINAEDTD